MCRQAHLLRDNEYGGYSGVQSGLGFVLIFLGCLLTGKIRCHLEQAPALLLYLLQTVVSAKISHH